MPELPASPAEASPARHRDLDRFLTFLDAIVAIALTLLVLPLTDLGAEIRHGESVRALLNAHRPQLWGFCLSFAVIARLWLIQHSVMRPVLTLDRHVTRLLLLWSFSIVVLPFATELVAQAGDDRATKIIYFGCTILAAATLAGVEGVTRRHPETADPGMRIGDPVHGWVNVALIAVGLGLTLLWPGLSYFPMLLLLLDDQVHSLVRRAVPER
ncbi:TMEM175 family protein [Nocardioides sp. BP30]|uniref:TMEM175 family protein n=1 Tax=Nocardioides sp. BP30 TaxID=3036374 RepID=UPI002468FC09|nr:TMEM175 family protein [Nocardioides sp. BP30]WGL53368.1 TMEM175 family protein [Nocardioides sp. BP30]